MNNPHIIRKNSNPTNPPPEPGIHWINTVTNEEFFSVGTSSVDDWIPRRRSGFKSQIITLTEKNISDKYIILRSTPISPIDVAVKPLGGIEQLNGRDFEINGNILSWHGLGLDDFLEIDDVLIIQH